MLSMTGASPRSAATRAPSMVADITRRRRSSRKAICTSWASAKPRSASSERSWNSSNSTAATPSSVGSSRMSRVKMPSVTTSIRVLRETLDPNRIRRPTELPTRSPSVCAMRSAAARAASRRGSRTRIRRPFAHASWARTSGTRVVLPAPGGATSTATFRSCSWAVKFGKTASIGSGAGIVKLAASVLHRL